MPLLLQRLAAGLGLVILGPVIVALGLAVRLTSPGPAFHRATRVRPGGTFTLFKLRSMRVHAAASGPGVTMAGDARVTRLGRLLRRTKVDELPQLWNVVRGDMALVGPRPEDPDYVDLADPLHRRVFGARPGITGTTALAYRDEESVLAATALEFARADGRDAATSDDLDRAYRERILPAKLAMDAEYLDHRSWRGDLDILWATVLGRGIDHGGTPFADLAYDVEWGGQPWVDLVVEALNALGDLRGLRVLEIGARSGRMACRFASLGATVVALDITPGFDIEGKAEALRRGQEDRIDFRLDDGRLGSVAGEQFDVVFTKSVLVVVRDRESYLKSVAALLDGGGRLVAIENGRGGRLEAFLRRVRRTKWDPRAIDYLGERDLKTLERLFDVKTVRRHRLPPIYLVVAQKRS